MRPRERRESGEQDLFRSRLDQIISMDHALVKLARTIDWVFLEEKFGAVYKDGAGQPPLPTRLVAGRVVSQAPLQPQRRGRVRAVDRESVLPILLRGGVFPAPAAARPFLDDPLAQPHGRRAAAGA